ncbi:MAG: dihydropteroate synthase [Bacteroidota bacterium]
MTINCNGELIDLSVPKVMGILNLTPDSFFDGGKYQNQKTILKHVEKMLAEGATFIDIGAYSSRPDAIDITEEEELKRIVKTVTVISKEFAGAILSIDTFRSKVAKECLDHGATMINDISSGQLNLEMFDVVAKYQVPYIMMHMKGTPQNMQDHTEYQDLVRDMAYYFSERINIAQSKKINDVIIDPGFGFSKTLAQNYHLLANLDFFSNLDVPILVGLSRKSMLYKLLKNNPEEALNATTAMHAVALLKGAHILRVHDVKEAVECVNLMGALSANKD